MGKGVQNNKICMKNRQNDDFLREKVVCSPSQPKNSLGGAAFTTYPRMAFMAFIAVIAFIALIAFIACMAFINAEYGRGG